MTREEFNQKLAQAESGDAQAQNDVAFVYSNATCEGLEKDLPKAFEWYLKSAEQGNLNSIDNLGGWCYLYGNGTDKNPERALYWMQKAMDIDATNEWRKNHYAEALNNMADCYANAKMGIEKDLPKAFELFLKSAELGNLNSIDNVGGWCYLWGNGTEKNNERALYWMQKAMDIDATNEWRKNAYANALAGRGWELYVGTATIAKDVNEAFRLFSKSAEYGNTYGISNLGNCYQTGQGVAKDIHKAKELYDKAIAAGHPMNDILKGWIADLDKELAECDETIVLHAMDLIASNIKEARRSLQPLADKGNLEAKTLLAQCYIKENMPVTTRTIQEWERQLKECEDQGCYLAYFFHGYGYLDFSNPEKPGNATAIVYFDYMKNMPIAYCEKYIGSFFYGWHCFLAQNYFQYQCDGGKALRTIAEKGAELNDGYSLFMLGCLYRKEKDLNKAKNYFNKAFNAKGSKIPNFDLKSEALLGLGNTAWDEHDFRTAVKYYKFAALNGNAVAMQYLSDSYAEGLGCEKDLQEAAEWAKKAKKAGWKQ